MQPHWDDLKIFLAVARNDSLSGAGRVLKVDPATVGRRIARLEEALRAPLFAKSPQGYALTNEGHRLLEHAMRAEQEMNAAFEDLAGQEGQLSGQIRLGAPDGSANFLLPQVCTEIVERNPDLEVQIVALLRSLQQDTGMSVMLITHDLGVVAEVADWVVVMYAGKVVEKAHTEDLFKNPKHPYTRGLLGSLPAVRKLEESAGARQADGSRRHLATIRGVVPDLRSLAQGCRFRDRCDDAVAACAQEEPALLGPEAHQAACFVRAENLS